MIILYLKSILCSKSCAFVWVADFWCLIASFSNPDTFTTFHCWRLCLAIIDRFFTRGRIYLFLLILGTYFLYHFNQSCDSVGRCPIYRVHPIKHKHSVDLPTTHSHPFNVISLCICNVCVIAYEFHVLYVMNVIWTTPAMHHIMHFRQL